MGCKLRKKYHIACTQYKITLKLDAENHPNLDRPAITHPEIPMGGVALRYVGFPILVLRPRILVQHSDVIRHRHESGGITFQLRRQSAQGVTSRVRPRVTIPSDKLDFNFACMYVNTHVDLPPAALTRLISIEPLTPHFARGGTKGGIEAFRMEQLDPGGLKCGVIFGRNFPPPRVETYLFSGIQQIKVRVVLPGII